MTTAQPPVTPRSTESPGRGIPWMRLALWAAVIFTVLFSLGPPDMGAADLHQDERGDYR